MSGHTPGPWKDGSMLFSAGWRCVVNLPGSRSIDIADPRNRSTDEEDKANAALIASAPDLLVERDALKLEVHQLRGKLEEVEGAKSSSEIFLMAAIEREDKLLAYIAALGCDKPERCPTFLDDKNYEPCGKCMPCRAKYQLDREKPVNEICWCAAKAEAKDAVCPIHG